jgi:peptide/nickel transport system substrate-binding protein
MRFAKNLLEKGGDAMRYWKRSQSIFLAVVACALAIVLSNCNSPSNQTSNNPSPATSPAAAPTGALVYGAGGQPTSLDSGNITDGNSVMVQDQIYNRLIEFKPGTTEIEPGLATEWTASEDGKTWTFKLRQGVKFHDGTDFNAEAVRFNIERWWDEKNEFGYRDAGKTFEIWTNLFGGFKGSPDSLLQEVTTEGTDTIRFVLKQPFAAFPNAIASGYFGIASPDAIKKAGAAYGTPSAVAVGTGPFLFKSGKVAIASFLKRILTTGSKAYRNQINW